MPPSDRDRLLDTLGRGRPGPDRLRTVDVPPRRAATLPPLQLQQRPSHRHAASGRHPGRRIRDLEAAGSVGGAGGEGGLDPGPHDRAADTDADGRPATARSSASARWPCSTSPRPRATTCRWSVAPLEGADPGAWFGALADRAVGLGYSVESAELDGATNGDCNYTRRRIRVECRNQPGAAGQDVGPRVGPCPPPRGDRRPVARRARGRVGGLHRVSEPRDRLRRLLVRVCGVLGRGRVGGRGRPSRRRVGRSRRRSPRSSTGSERPRPPRRRPERHPGRFSRRPWPVRYERAISSHAASTPSNPPTSVRLCGSRSL